MVHRSRRRPRIGRRAEATLRRGLLLGLSLAVVAAACTGPGPSPSPSGEVVRRFAALFSVAPAPPLDLQLLAEEIDASLDATGIAGETTVTPTTNGLEIRSTAGAAALEAALTSILVAPGPVRLLDPGPGEVSGDRPVDPSWQPVLVGTWVDASSVSVTKDPAGRRNVVQMRLVPDAALVFSTWTQAHLGSAFVVEVDGRVVSAPRLNAAIPRGELLIVTSREEAAIRLAAALRATGGLTFVQAPSSMRIASRPGPRVVDVELLAERFDRAPSAGSTPGGSRTPAR